MNPASDERFYELAIKVAAGRGAPGEQAELNAMLAAEPSRANDYERVKENVAVAKDVVPILYERFVKVPPLPDQYRQRLHQRAAEVFGAPQAATQPSPPKELSPKEMEALVLKVIAERPMDGFALTTSLEKAQIKTKGGGEGTLYGLLARLESSGYLEGHWRERGSRMIKTYHLTEKGTGLLQNSKTTAAQLQAWSQAVLAFGSSQD